MQTADPAGFEILSRSVLNPKLEVVTYSGCIADSDTMADIISSFRSGSICKDIPNSRKRIAAMCERAG